LTQAVEADNAHDYERAYNLYNKSHDHFMLAVKFELNTIPRVVRGNIIPTLLTSMHGYKKRALQLKEMIDQGTSAPKAVFTRTQSLFRSAAAAASGGGGGTSASRVVAQGKCPQPLQAKQAQGKCPDPDCGFESFEGVSVRMPSTQSPTFHIRHLGSFLRLSLLGSKIWYGMWQ
jgi:hypothetical protein